MPHQSTQCGSDCNRAPSARSDRNDTVPKSLMCRNATLTKIQQNRKQKSSLLERRWMGFPGIPSRSGYAVVERHSLSRTSVVQTFGS